MRVCLCARYHVLGQVKPKARDGAVLAHPARGLPKDAPQIGHTPADKLRQHGSDLGPFGGVLYPMHLPQQAVAIEEIATIVDVLCMLDARG